MDEIQMSEEKTNKFAHGEQPKSWLTTFISLMAISFLWALTVEVLAKDGKSAKSNSANIQTRKICKTTYKEQVVYYHTGVCCDIPSLLVDANGKFICHPDGGFISVDKRCPDFLFDESKSLKIDGMPDYLLEKERKIKLDEVQVSTNAMFNPLVLAAISGI